TSRSPPWAREFSSPRDRPTSVHRANRASVLRAAGARDMAGLRSFSPPACGRGLRWACQLARHGRSLPTPNLSRKREGDSELPVPAERIAVHHLNALGGVLVADGVRGREVLLRPRCLAAIQRLLDLRFANRRRLRPQPQVGASEAVKVQAKHRIHLLYEPELDGRRDRKSTRLNSSH